MTAPVANTDEAVRPGRAGEHPDRFWWWVGIAALVGLAVRVAWGLWVANPPQGLFDPARYAGYAGAIADGQGMIEGLSVDQRATAYYPPGYPWFLGIVTWVGRPVTDDIALLGAMVQSALGAATVVGGAVVGRRLGGHRAGIVAAFGLALYPNLVFHSGALLGETLYNALFVAFCVLVLTTRMPHGLTTTRVVATGLVLGLAVMVRPISLAVVPAVALSWWLATRDRRLVARSVMVLVLAVGACIAPWTVRNAVRMDAFVPISTNTGENLCIGHAPGATGAFVSPAACDTGHDFLAGPDQEVAADQEKTAIAVRAIADDPGRQPMLLWRRFWVTWVHSGDHDGIVAVQSYRTDRFIGAPTDDRLAYGADVAYWLVAVTGVFGLAALGWRRRPHDVFWVGAAIMTAAVPLVFFGDSRFKVPVIPLLIVAAATLVRTPTPAVASEPTPEPDPPV
ncbi:hypothetical protein BH23ACT2_BH23ACT2_04640 [soil metagenome]